MSAADVERHGRAFVPERPHQRLFDLITDPGERTNLLAEGLAAAQPGLALKAERARALVAAMDGRLRAYVRDSHGRGETVTLSPQTLTELEALGYVQ